MNRRRVTVVGLLTLLAALLSSLYAKGELLFQRAVQSYLWAQPALNMYGMKEQRPICSVGPIGGKTWCGDVGLPGPDKGKGGNYLVLPPDYKGRVPKGYFTLRSRTYGVFVFWRAFFKDGVSHRPRRRRHPVAAGADGAMVRGSPVDQRVPGQRRLHGPFLVIERLQQQGAGK